MSPVVEVRDLTVRFGTVVAVDGFDLTLAAGASVALVGRNGAGKSTTLRVLAGVLPPTSGSVRVGGVDAVKDPSGAKARVGYCPDVGGLIPRATPWEHLQLAATLRGMPDGWQSTGPRPARPVRPRRRDADRVTASFSHGMGRRLSVVLAAFHSPDVLLLDEPFDGVDPLGVDATLDVIRELRLGGSAVLVSTHLLDLAVQACDEAVVLRRGAVVAAAPLERARRGRRRRSLPVAAVVSTSQLAAAAGTAVADGALTVGPAGGSRSLAGALPVLCLVAVGVGAGSPSGAQSSTSRLWRRRRTSRWLCSRSLAPLAAGGGNELFPTDQLSAYPITARTQYLASLALTPLNLAWTTQLVALIGLTAYVSGPSAHLPLALLTCLAYFDLRHRRWPGAGLAGRRHTAATRPGGASPGWPPGPPPWPASR